MASRTPQGEEARPAAGPVREADALAASAGRFLALCGLAYANAGFSHLESVTPKDEAGRPKAVAYLQQAVKYTESDDPAGKRHRAELEKQSEILKRKDAAKEKEPDSDD